MTHPEIGALLVDAREEAGLTQTELAKRLKLHQSQVSRLESGDGKPEIADYDKYLRTVGSKKAINLARKLKVTWKHLSRPSLRHPNIEALIEAEIALDRLETFIQNKAMPRVLAGQAGLLFRRLLEFGEFLLSLDHKIVYVGDIGVGKTTAACRQAGLVTDLTAAHDLKGMMLDTGGGRVTLCDVNVQRGDKFAIHVNPLTDEEIYRLVEDLCHAIKEKHDGETPVKTSVDYRPPEEIERALRNMTKLTRPTRKLGEPPVADPITVIGIASSSLEEFKAEVASRLTLWGRTRRTIEFEGTDPDEGRLWLKNTFTAINSGRHSDFSLPDKITVTVPFSLVSGTPFNVTLIDTRGVDGSAVRPDLTNHLKDRRAVTVLCSKWGSAPDTSLQELIKHVSETEVDPSLVNRIAILVLPRSGDGLSMRHDSGESVSDPTEGYGIKCYHVEDALQRINLMGIDVAVFDATYDNPAKLTSFLVSKIEASRTTQCANARATIHAVDQMLENVEVAEALATLENANKDLQIFADRHNSLTKNPLPAHNRLLNAIRTRHPSTVWAATRRAGSFWNFDVYQHLGDGASADAKRRCRPALDGLREIIKNKLEDPTHQSVHSFLDQILDDIATWESEFVRAARHYAVTIYKPMLSSSKKIWADCEDKYGRGIDGYREEIASLLESWFEDHSELQDKLDGFVNRAWKVTVIKPLRAAAGSTYPQKDSL